MFPRLIHFSHKHSFFLFGPRGTGKSTLLKERFNPNECLWLDLLDLELEERFIRNPSELYAIVKALPEKIKYVVIDEIQKVSKLLDEVHRLIEETKKIFILTGSSARKLKYGGANLLAGRAFVSHLYSLSCFEIGKDFEQRQLAYNNSLINFQTTQKRLAQLKTQLQNEFKRANVNYDINQKLFSDYSIKSSINGRVYDILKDRGELVTPQTPLAVIGKADTFLLELAVDENDIIKVAIGQKALITMDSYKGEVLDAIVDKIYPIMNERTRTFVVEAHFINAPKKLFPNLSAEANIIIQTKKNIITIPNNYIIDGKYVLINSDNADR